MQDSNSRLRLAILLLGGRYLNTTRPTLQEAWTQAGRDDSYRFRWINRYRDSGMHLFALWLPECGEADQDGKRQLVWKVLQQIPCPCSLKSGLPVRFTTVSFQQESRRSIDSWALFVSLTSYAILSVSLSKPNAQNLRVQALINRMISWTFPRNLKVSVA